MEAAEAKVQKVLEGSKQFLVPHFQRPYSWRDSQWKPLWRDLIELVEDAEAKPHFLGSIVTAPARSVPEGVEKRLLIDGQQRLTTLLVLLVLIRNRAREAGNAKLAERIQDLVTNRHDDGPDRYKLLPTQAEDVIDSDREAFVRLVGDSAGETKSGIGAATTFFSSKLRRSDAPELETLFRVIVTKLTMVSIILGDQDNPHRIFESLNGTGRPLSQADLIRNYFFMRLDPKEHERAYVELWRPIQRRLGEEVLTDFVRHYLMRFGAVIRETDVYTALKSRVDEDKAATPLDHLKEIARYAGYYEVFLQPETAPSPALRERFDRIRRLEVTVAYPFLLGIYADFASGRLSEGELCELLDLVENFVIRRFVCGIPTYGLNKIFAVLYEQARQETDFTGRVKRGLASSPRAYPRDTDFRDRLSSARLYGGGERREKTKLMLERLEAALGHKESVSGALLTIEHVMPQTLTEEWKAHLGADWEEDHEQFLHTLGNLTLTSYNPELSNAPFAEKRKLFAESHVELNRHLASLTQWTTQEIERRAEVLTELALSTWPYFGPQQPEAELDAADVADVTGTIPRTVHVRGVETPVQSWVDVAVAAMEGILAIGDDEFARVTAELPKFVNMDATAFRRSSRLKKLSNGAYLETNLSASAIYRLSSQAAQLAGLGPEEWSVDYEAAGDDGDEDDAAAPSTLRKLQLEFWTAVRAALLATGKVTVMGKAGARHSFFVALGKTGVHMSLTVKAQARTTSVKIVLRPQFADRVLAVLDPERAVIETFLGFPLDWDPPEAGVRRTIKVSRSGDIQAKETWPETTQWLVDTAVAMHAVFAPRVAQLDLQN